MIQSLLQDVPLTLNLVSRRDPPLPYTSLCGFGPVPSAIAYGVPFALNLAGMIAAEWLSDRVHRPQLLAIIYAARAAATELSESLPSPRP
jgi:hypothetical protein